MSAPPDIFLSYNREDQAVARRFAEAFEREGFSVWWDATLRSGEAYDQVTERALKTAKAVVVLWSPRSVESRWVRAEATLADRNKTLVPAMIEPCDRPIMFELTQTADLSRWTGDPSDPGWLAFLSDVRRFAERERPLVSNTSTAVVVASAATAVSSTGAPPSVSTAAGALGERRDAPSLAVLPFTNRSGLSEDEVFAIGMVEDVIDALSQGVHVRVISSAATARFHAGAIPDLRALTRELGVRYILEGNVRRSAASLRVTAQLIDALTGEILWTQRFDRPLTELAALQEELVLEVAAHLDTQVHRIEMERALKKPGDLTAWEAVMRAVGALRSLNTASVFLCLQEARKAVSIAPDYGLAHAVLAMAAALHFFGACPGPDDMSEVRRIRDHVDRALALDPNNALLLAHVSRALTYSGDPEDGLRHGQRAVRLSPGAALVHYSCGLACVALGRSEEALAHFDADLRTSPGAPTNFLNFGNQGHAHVQAGRWNEALAAYDQALALLPAYGPALMLEAVVYRRNGRAAEARDLLLRARLADREVEPARLLSIWERLIGNVFRHSRVREELLQLLRSLWAEAEFTAA